MFLYWLPCILRMSRPPSRQSMVIDYPPTPCSNNSEQQSKSHHHLQGNNHLNILTDVEMKQRCSKSLLANVLDINDDFRHNNCRPLLSGSGVGVVGASSTLPPNSTYFRTVFRYAIVHFHISTNIYDSILIKKKYLFLLFTVPAMTKIQWEMEWFRHCIHASNRRPTTNCHWY